MENKQFLNEELNKFLNNCVQNESLILTERKQELDQLSDIISKYNHQDRIPIQFICTHNSRRSQAAQLLLQTACSYHQINKIDCYSGGTESTAFNERMVKALRSFGFIIESSDQNDNPKYEAKSSSNSTIINPMFSKIFDDEFNPQSDFIAIMVCDSAHEFCPIVTGSTERLPLLYIDPKYADNTDEELDAYKKTINIIGREMFYLAKKLVGIFEDQI